jgi:IMP dehydrogenase
MSKLQEARPAYTFDDMVLVPVYSKVKSRKEPSISTDVPGFQYDLPVVSSPMNTVTETEMLLALHSIGGVGVLHRYMSIESQVKIVNEVTARLSDAGPVKLDEDTPPFYVAVGANGDFQERIRALRNAGVTGFCVDVANGHNELSVQAVRAIRRLVPDARIMAGNVCTFDGAVRLAEAGANSIRVGIGGGSVCTTRQVTGHGLPQLTAIEDCVRIKSAEYYSEPYGMQYKSYPDVAIIADGGIRKSGDIVKALAAGADAVMIGSLIAGTEETPGEWLDEGGKLYKYYHGMASDEGRAQWKGQVSGVPAEGVSTKVLYTGKQATKIIQKMCGSVQVGLSISGAANLRELRFKAKWARVTPAGYIEGTPHGK